MPPVPPPRAVPGAVCPEGTPWPPHRLLHGGPADKVHQTGPTPRACPCPSELLAGLAPRSLPLSPGEAGQDAGPGAGGLPWAGSWNPGSSLPAFIFLHLLPLPRKSSALQTFTHPSKPSVEVPLLSEASCHPGQ